MIAILNHCTQQHRYRDESVNIFFGFFSALYMYQRDTSPKILLWLLKISLMLPMWYILAVETRNGLLNLPTNLVSERIGGGNVIYSKIWAAVTCHLYKFIVLHVYLANLSLHYNFPSL